MLIVGGIILVGFVWFFLVGIVPKSYNDCLKTHTNDYSRNELFCSYSPRTPAEQRVCVQKNGIINQFKQCLIVYYNPAFMFPKSLTECGNKLGFIDMNKTTCDIQIGNKGAYDEVIANDLVEKCLQNGGQKMSGSDCWIRFTPNGIKF